MSTPAFMTGSRVYGKPREDSDVDLVVFIDSDTHVELRRQAGVGKGQPIRFGKLNLICCDTPEQYDGWVQATQVCLKGAPLTRDEAIAIFNALKVTEPVGASG